MSAPWAGSKVAAHPRSRGEHYRLRSGPSGACGSSPLARGTPTHTRVGASSCRLIPARAGNTGDDDERALPEAAHPRSRGEHRLLPPHLRACFWLIPARAGNTPRQYRRRACQPAHPRSRGEHWEPTHRRLTDIGSSPLARGTPGHVVGFGLGVRLIPARAGNTSNPTGPRKPATAHPRSRGEHASSNEASWCPSGSSPLARGTRDAWLLSGDSIRLIPARAGNTRMGRRRAHAHQAHPRSRGEHPVIAETCAAYSGSSPLARGTRTLTVTIRRRIRLIPARAGNTPWVCGLWGCLPAHPRSRGEHEDPSPALQVVRGSSPLARGTQVTEGRGQTSGRLIPARAGNTTAFSTPGCTGTAHPRSRGEHEPKFFLFDFRDGSSPLARGTRR